MNQRHSDETSTPRSRRPTGVLVSILTLPIGFFGLLRVFSLSWDLARELYCRRFHESSPILCRYIGFDFRIDLMFIALVLLVLYPILHFWCLRAFMLRSHLLLMACVAIVGFVVKFAASGLMSGGEAWLK